MGKEEIDPIQKVLNKLNIDVPIIIITINKTEANDYVAFDTSSPELMPLSGTIIEIAKLKYLLFNNAKYSESGTVKDYPFHVGLYHV